MQRNTAAYFDLERDLCPMLEQVLAQLSEYLLTHSISSLDKGLLLNLPICSDFSKAIEDVGIFNFLAKSIDCRGKFQNATHRQMFANWLLVRGLEVSAARAVEDVKLYLSASEIDFYVIALVHGILFEDDFEALELGDGVFVSPIETPPVRFFRGYAKEGANWRSSLATALLFKKISRPRREGEGAFSSLQTVDNVEAIREEINDARLIYATQSQKGIQLEGFTTIPADSVPHWGGSFVLHRNFLGPVELNGGILERDATCTKMLLEQFRRLDRTERERLSVPLRFYNDYLSVTGPEDRAMFLRVCSEALFLDDNETGELRYRLGLRAAFYLADELDERKSVIKAVRDGYDIGSRAIHSGRIQSTKTSEEKLDHAASLVRKAILKRIETGPVDWNEIVLQSK
ncbi:hypothetical protein EOI86_06580 [Hwanghaeella grinnelliae]|uniref:Uncharacterized protein n=1 Tax=Hwanghaeella grinnelliae TaxID=2500179 RepID=A0A437QWL0_9PROT|nr:hypothetical protein [Hwanghaeella grinnelliae]RVU38925.1 hypothetical protein EOI86_06580 [Hwanghaeella grinnelliae]